MRGYVRLLLLCLLLVPVMRTQQVPVRHREGLVHGFLVLRTLAGETIADGDLIQNARGDRVTSRVVFHFKDGSLHDDTAVYSQRGSFQLVSEHLVQKGPSFKHPVDVRVDRAAGRVTVRYTDDDGKEKTADEHMQLPPNTANGVILTLLKNIPTGTKGISLPYVVATPKPRLVKLVVSPQGEESFATGSTVRKALHYVAKVDIGGLTGVVAKLFGEQPPDTHVWILVGEAPAFVRSEGPLAAGGPVWRIELVSPSWSSRAAASEK